MTAGDAVEDVVQAYVRWFGAPTRVIRGELATTPLHALAVVVYLPTESERKDPDGNLTLIGTAGLSGMSIAQDFKTEVAIEVTGSLDNADEKALAEALVDIGTAPLKTGRRFCKGDLLTNVQLPLFPRFHEALLIDWDLVDGFEFPELSWPVSLLRVAPLFALEVAAIEASEDRCRTYLDWVTIGLKPQDPGRRSFA